MSLASAETFAANFRDTPDVVFPTIYREFSGKRVLCMQYLDGLRRWNDWEDYRKAVRAELIPLLLWPDGGAGLSAQASLFYTLLDQEAAKRPSQWKELQPDETWPDLHKVGVWTDDYSNIVQILSLK